MGSFKPVRPKTRVGTFIRADAPVKATKQEMLSKAATRYAGEVRALGVSQEEAIEALKEVY